MLPFDPVENNLRLAREFCEKANRAMPFNYQDLKDSPADCLASASTLTHDWIGADVPCGAIVLLSMDTIKFAEIQDDLDKFFKWFENLIKSIVDKFLVVHPGFDFINDAAEMPNKFTQWITSDLKSQSIDALKKVIEIVSVFKYYAGDMFDVKDNPMRAILDSTLNAQIKENLSLRTVLEAMGVKFND